MQKEFLSYKLSRINWILPLEKLQIDEAIKEYNQYKKRIEESINIENKEEFDKELIEAEKVFLSKMNICAKKAKEQNDVLSEKKCREYLLEYDKDNLENIKAYINWLEEVHQYDLQLELAKYYYTKSKDSDAYKLLSRAYEKNKIYNKSTGYYIKYLCSRKNKKPDAAEYCALGANFYNLYITNSNPGDAQNALLYFSRALKLEPRNKTYLKNTILAAAKTKNWEVEKSCWETFKRLGYMDADEEFSYAAACQKNGDIEGWMEHYDCRFRTKKASFTKPDKPLWTGIEDLKDKTLLVLTEQGYGDNFLMFGYMPRLVKLAKHVIYYIQDGAYELIKDNKWGVEASCKKIAGSPQNLNFDYYIPCMSIPIALHCDKSNISVKGGYITPNKEEKEEYRKTFFNNDKFKIGFSYKGGFSNGVYLIPRRNMDIDKLLPFDELDNVQLYCITQGIENEELEIFKKNKIINLGKTFGNFAQTAAAIANLDILISTDNGILNLAGAIGKKTIALFNYNYTFRWYDLSGKDSGWFENVIPIVNDEHNNWEKSVSKAIELVKKEMNNRGK